MYRNHGLLLIVVKVRATDRAAAVVAENIVARAASIPGVAALRRGRVGNLRYGVNGRFCVWCHTANGQKNGAV